MSNPAFIPKSPVGRIRWIICGLLFLACVLSYIDRLVLSVLKPTLQHRYNWSEEGYSDVVFWFQAVYGLGFLFFGRLVDKVGAKVGYLLAMTVWTAAHMAHALVTSTFGFVLVRLPLALGESGTYPAGLAAIAEWFPKRERALAIGIFNAGANVGAVVTPLIVPAITLALNWQSAFLITGLFNIAWIAAWTILYRRPRRHPRISQAEIDYIESEPFVDQGRAPYRAVLSTRQAWAYMAGRFLIDPIWWTFLFWLPDFFAKRYGVSLKDFGPPLVAIYLLADIGSIFGGWLSSRMLVKGYSANVSRKTAMLVCALIVVPVVFAQWAPSIWIAVVLLGMACAGHQGFSSNHFALPADAFPRFAQGTVVGLGGFAGALGGMLMAKYAGYILDKFGSYTPIFIVAGSAYLLALLVIQLINPRYESVTKLTPEN